MIKLLLILMLTLFSSCKESNATDNSVNKNDTNRILRGNFATPRDYKYGEPQLQREKITTDKDTGYYKKNTSKL